MRVRLLRILNFRGFEEIEFKPREHVLVVGEPGAGRSDLAEALWRVLSAESSRFPLSEDLDFFDRDLGKRIEVEVVLGDLGPHLEQAFLDRLELWDLNLGELVEELNPESEESQDSFEHVVRLCYRAVWDPDRQQAQQWVDFPKFSDPAAGDFRYVPRELRGELPVAFVTGSDSPLSLGARGDLRRLIDTQTHTDFPAAIENLMRAVAQLAEGLVESKDLGDVLERILNPLRIPLNLENRPAGEIVRFAPEGGSLAGVLRALQPTMKLREVLGFLPLARHGSTLTGLLRLSQAVAQRNNSNPIIVADDFGEDIDTGAALHLASTLRAQSA
jgi:putative ATP-dependent endonuclease of the OLD family